MTKRRQDIPAKIRDKVLKEFNHKCAICGTIQPQLHHIDEDPTNNDELNLIPLCPNCHLTDHHNPTKPVEPRILRLFREFKDPSILAPQFYTLFRRFQYLYTTENEFSENEAEVRGNELIAFVQELEMGKFYSAEVKKMIERPLYTFVLSWTDPTPQERQKLDQETQERAQEYRNQLIRVRPKIIELLIEMLRFQAWKPVH